MYTKQHYTKTPEGAVAKSILAGLDLDCGTFSGQHAMEALKAGLVNESAIEKAISNNFATLMRLGFFDGDPKKQPYGDLGPEDVCSVENQELAREAARQGIVLLKNSAGSLPLSPSSIKTLAVIGPNANATETMIGNYHGKMKLTQVIYRSQFKDYMCETEIVFIYFQEHRASTQRRFRDWRQRFRRRTIRDVTTWRAQMRI